jgi:hypothetical protein
MTLRNAPEYMRVPRGAVGDEDDEDDEGGADEDDELPDSA